MPWLKRSATSDWTDITHLISRPVTSGRLLFQQKADGDRVIAFDVLVLGDTTGGNIAVIPSELGRPAFTEAEYLPGVTNRVQITNTGNLQAYGLTIGPIFGRLTYSTKAVA